MDLKTVTSKGTKHARRRVVGRGPGSGLGKTSGRGHKGLGARSGSSRRPGYEGGQMPIYRRVPKRGFSNARFRTEYTVINVSALNAFEQGTEVDLDSILSRGLASLNTRQLKILGNGALERRLTVKAQKFSKSAAEKIQAAGGKVVFLDPRGRQTESPSEPREAEPK
jgi:large subunit ribosomal protein L15